MVEPVDLSAPVDVQMVETKETKITAFDTVIAAALIIGLPLLVYMLITGM